jgi:transcriptional regulator with PAS, ATPase and Fis domain
MERRAIMRALREAGGDKIAAAKVLRIGKTTLYRKLKQYELKGGGSC